MKILFVTSEAYPFATSGGLGEVSFALPKALNRRGIDCRVVMPLYSEIGENHRKMMRFVGKFTVCVGWRKQYCGLYKAEFDGVKFIFIDNEYYFKRDKMYGEYDDAERFAYFCRAALDTVENTDFIPDVIHCNDWHSALVPAYLKFLYYNRPKYQDIRTVLTIHNIQYQGSFPSQILGDIVDIPEWARPAAEFDGGVNYLKAGIEIADRVTTVSPTYADEILKPFYAYSLEGILSAKKWKLSGILNGIDCEIYDPETDSLIYKKYGARSLKNKLENKKRLCDELKLDYSANIPTVAMVSRLASAKGIELVQFAFEEMMRRDMQLVVIGSGEPEYERFFCNMQKKYGGRFAYIQRFDRALSHKIFAGSDIYLMPSKQEPCGLSQMVAMRYGTVPVVRKTGGLGDTVSDNGGGDGLGYTFKNYSAFEMMDALSAALAAYGDKPRWYELMMRDMAQNHSWERSADEYIQLYKTM